MEPQKHFLFHIFRMDKADNPMPANRAAAVLQAIRAILADGASKD